MMVGGDREIVPGILRILHPSGVTVGTAFIAGTRLALTCAHVMKAVGASPGSTVEFSYLALDGLANALGTATVDQASWREVADGDIAVLRLHEPLPAGIRVLPIASAVSAGHRVRTLGFPGTGTVSSLNAVGTIVGVVNDGRHPRIDMDMERVDEGFSGAPVFDEDQGVTVGIVTTIITASEARRHAAVTLAIPLSEVLGACPELAPSAQCPYRNLDLFEEEHAKFYFGRERLIEVLLERLRGESRFLAILGPSGSGKSSLVRAGLIPRLRSGTLRDSERWKILVVRPRDDPWSELEAASVHSPRDDLAAACEEWRRQDPQASRLLLIIDQFEELFTRCPDHVRDEFGAALTALVLTSLRISVIIVQQSSAYASLSQHLDDLLGRFPTCLCNVPPTIARSELEAMIVGPARVTGLTVDPALVAALLDDTLKLAARPTTLGEPAVDNTVLPLLESALFSTWQRRVGTLLPFEAYPADRVTGALSQWASDAYASLPEALRPLARRIFLDLVDVTSVGPDRSITRRQRRASELVREPAEAPAVDEVIGRLGGARLLVTSGDAEGIRVEIIHDALIQRWSTLREWVETDLAFLSWRRDVEESAARWTADSTHDDGALLRGRRLEESIRWAEERRADLSSELVTYISVSAQHSTDAQKREQQLQARQLLDEALRLPEQHVDQRMLLLLRSYTTFPTSGAYSILVMHLGIHARLLKRMRADAERPWCNAAFSGDGRRLVIAESNGFQIWEPATTTLLTRVRVALASTSWSGAFGDLSVSSLGGYVACRLNDTFIVQAIGENVAMHRCEPRGKTRAVFSKGDRFLAWTDDNALTVYNIRSRNVIMTLPSASDLIFTFDERSLLFIERAVAKVQRFDLTTHERSVVKEVADGAQAWLTPKHLCIVEPQSESEFEPRVSICENSTGRELATATTAFGRSDGLVIVEADETLAMSAENETSVYDDPSGRILKLAIAPVNAISPDGHLLAIRPHIIDAASGAHRVTIPSGDRLAGFRTSTTEASAFVSGGDVFCTVSGSPGGPSTDPWQNWIECWDAQQTPWIRSVIGLRYFTDYAVSEDGAWLAVRHLDAVDVYELAGMRLACSLPCGTDIMPATYIVGMPPRLPAIDASRTIAFTPDSRLLIVQRRGDPSVDVFNCNDGFQRARTVAQLVLRGRDVAFSRESSSLFNVDNEKEAWSFENFPVQFRKIALDDGSVETYPPPSGRETHQVLSAGDARTILVLDVAGGLSSFDVETGTWTMLSLPSGTILRKLGAIPETQHVLGLTADGQLIDLDLQCTGEARRIGSVTFPNERLDVTSADLRLSPAGRSICISGVVNSVGAPGVVFVSLTSGERLGEMWLWGASQMMRTGSRLVATVVRPSAGPQPTAQQFPGDVVQLARIVYPEELADEVATTVNRSLDEISATER